MPLIKNLFLFTHCLLLSAFVAAQVPTVDSSRVLKLRIDPATAIGVPASEIFASVEYVPLETTKKSLFGNVNQLQIIDNKFIFYDMDTWSVLIFDQQGKFINRISAKKIAESSGLPSATNDGNVFRTFRIVKGNDKAHIEIIANRSVLKYDLNGEFIEKAKSEASPLVFSLKNSTEVLPFYTEDQKTWYEFALKQGERTALYFSFKLDKYETDDFYAQGGRFYPSTDLSSLSFIDYYSYDALNISAEGVRLKYRFIFPQNLSMPDDFAVNPVYKAKKWDQIKSRKQMIYGIHNLVEMGPYLYFSLAQYSQQISDKKTLAYHLRTGRLISLQHMIPDAGTYHLPTNDATYGNNFMGKGFLAYDETSFYTVISSLSMFRFDSENKAGRPSYPPHLKKYFEGNPTDNPVIVKITPKK